jgi:TonB family protein
MKKIVLLLHFKSLLMIQLSPHKLFLSDPALFREILIGLFLCLPFYSFPQVSNLDREDHHIASNIGGKYEFKRLFEQELIYPENSLKNKVGGKVELSFKVKADSTLEDVKIIRSVNEELDKEALRIFRMYKWVPAREIGKPIDSYAFATFNFQPQKYKDICKKRGYEKVTYPDMPIDSTFKIYTKVDELPAYVGGNENLDAFIYKNLEYPAQLAHTGVSGQVILGFVVEPSGLMSNIGVLKSLGLGCDQEAIRVLEMIKWKPGTKKGKLVRTRMSLPFTFQLKTSYR